MEVVGVADGDRGADEEVRGARLAEANTGTATLIKQADPQFLQKIPEVRKTLIIRGNSRHY
jgi:hypothetical protein